MAIDVGDAVFKFAADQTGFDTAIDELGPKAQAGFEPVAEAAEEAGERVKGSMREARGEVELLGRSMGVELPRHVRTFIAELPGVGQALSAAFSATAVLFVAQAVAQVAEKISQLAADNLIFTDTMKATNDEIASGNQAIQKLNEQREKAIEELAKLKGETQDQTKAEQDLTIATLNQVKAQYDAALAAGENKGWWDKTKDAVKDLGVGLANLIPGWHLLTSAEQEEQRVQAAGNTLAAASVAAQQALAAEAQKAAEAKRQQAIQAQITELDNQKKIALASAEGEQQRYQIEVSFGQKRLALLREIGNSEKSQIQQQIVAIEVLEAQHTEHIKAELQKQADAFKKLMGEVNDLRLRSVPDLGLSKDNSFEQYEEAAQKLGITIRGQLVAALVAAKTAFDQLNKSGHASNTELIEAQNKVAALSKQLDDFGRKVPQQAQNMLEFQKTIGDAFDAIGSGINSAMKGVVDGTESFGKAMEKATLEAIAGMAQQWGAYYIALGTANLFIDPVAGAEEIAGGMALMALAGALSGVAGNVNASSSSTSTEQLHNTVSNTTSQSAGSRGVSGVQGFATGALITGPTLAMVGEGSRPEAVIPLTDPEAMEHIGAAIAKHVAGAAGGRGGLNVNVGGLVSDDSLVRIMKRMSKLVSHGQANLVSSNTLRITKRSA